MGVSLAVMARPLNSRVTRQREQLVQTLLRLCQVVDLFAEATGTPSTLSARQRLTLVILAAGGPLHLTQLAQRLGVSLPTAAHTIAILEQQGFVCRKRDSHDRRAILVTITPAGEAALDVTDQRSVAIQQALTVLTDEELDELTRGLTLLLTALLQRIAGLTTAPQPSKTTSPHRRRHISAA
jgi:DNA-binding MarR family transcriptional regulator